MSQSKAGKSITIKLEKLHKKNINTFKKKEDKNHIFICLVYLYSIY